MWQAGVFGEELWTGGSKRDEVQNIFLHSTDSVDMSTTTVYNFYVYYV